ncbi:E3 SUMO-protein ligase ZBED1-like [Tachysurus ichikawai]
MFQAEERNAVYEQARRLVREFNCMLTPPASVPATEPEATPRVDKAGRVKRKEMSLVNGRMEVKNLPRETRFSATLRVSSSGTERTF